MVCTKFKCKLSRGSVWFCLHVTINGLYLACMIYGGICFYNKLAWISFRAFLYVTIYILIYFTFGDVFNLADAVFHQKRHMENTQQNVKCLQDIVMWAKYIILYNINKLI